MVDLLRRASTKSRISRLASTGWRPGIMWSAPSTTTSGAPVSSASARAATSGWQRSSVPWTRSIGQRTARQIASTRRRSSSLGDVASASIASTDRRRAHSTASSICFVECGSRRDLAEEEAREARVVAAPVVAVDLRPALVGRQLVLERVLDAPGCGGDRTARRRQTRRSRRRVPARRGELDRPPHGVAAQARRGPPSVPVASMTARCRRRCASSAYAVGLGRAVRPAVAATVVGDDPVVAAEVRDLALPLARVDDRRRRQQHDRRRARAEHFERDPDAVGRRSKPVSSGRRARPRVSGPAGVASAGVMRSPPAPTKSRISRLTRTGSRASGMCPAALDELSRAPGIASASPIPGSRA